MEEYELMKDSKYRVYVSAVDKALKNFEYTSEWADLIAALGKLNKVLLSYTKFPVIPRRIKLSKRLAQCMHPALPAGVHLKALETYDIIFKCMGTNRLAQELFIYSAGLFPLLGHAATPVRPTLLAVYEAHFVPLGERLIPALPGFLAGVLPGLEPGSDHYDSTNGLLERVCASVGPQSFYAALWRCIRFDSPARAPAVAFALVHINRKSSSSVLQPHLQGENSDLMINALESAVQDGSVLVQRSALDLLLIALPAHGIPAPSVALMSAALHSVLRRDMSLNRRLYSWLLGSEVNVNLLSEDHPLVLKMKCEAGDHKSADNLYYKMYSHDTLLQAIQTILAQSCSQRPADIRPYRLLTSLLDKPEIAPEILDVILFDVFRALYLTSSNQLNDECVEIRENIIEKSQCAQKTHLSRKKLLLDKCQELVKHANLLFNTLETYYIWQYVGDLFEKGIGASESFCKVFDVGSGSPNVLELCLLTDFLLDVIPIETYIDSSSEILPNLFIRVVTLITNNLSVLSSTEITETLKLCINILTKIQPISVKTVIKNDLEPVHSLEQTDNMKLDSDVSEKSKSTLDLFEISKSIKFQSEVLKYEFDKTVMTNDVQIASKESLKTTLSLEKSKSDSKLNENGLPDIMSEERERSNSNQMLRRFQVRSPKSDKKTKNKKSKSSPKLFGSKLKDTIEQHHVSEGLQVSERLTTKIITTEIENKLIVKCLEVYKLFFMHFIKDKVFKNISLDNFYQHFVCYKRFEEESSKKLEVLLRCCIGEKNSPIMNEKICDINQLKQDFIIDFPLNEYVEAVKTSSMMLLEFTAFPNILDIDVLQNDLPDWLKYLAVMSCLNCEDSIDVQLVCMSVFLEIISLSKSLKQFKASENTVVLMGILRNEYVTFIENSTLIIEIMAQTLWDILGITTSQTQVITCVSLLYNIHNIFDSHGFAENIIGRYLVTHNESLEPFKRFSVLWHIGRDLDTKSVLNCRFTKHFDRCLLKVLDNLQNNENISLKLYAENFLLHSLLRNDVSRIVSPLLNILLSSNTARISVLHANIEKSDLDQTQNTQKIDDQSLKNIYAISSVDGHVMYHVADDVRKNIRKKSFPFMKTVRSTNEVVSISTSLVNDKSYVTEKNKDFKIDDNLNSKTKSNVKVFVNPLSFKDSGSEKSSIESLSSADSTSDATHDLISSGNDTTNLVFINEKELGVLNETASINGITDDFELTNEVPEIFTLQKKENESDQIVKQSSSFSPAKKVSAYLEQIEKISDGITQSDTVSFVERTLIKSHSLEENGNPKENYDSYENSGLVHSWSYGTNEVIQHSDSELEISTVAEEFFNDDGSSQDVIENIVQELIEEICKEEAKKLITDKTKSGNKSILKNKCLPKNVCNGPVSVGTAHSHLLLYCDVYDSNIILYAVRTLKNALVSNSRMLIGCLATTALQMNSEILNLLARHRKSVYGHGFYGDISNSEYINCYRGNMYLEAMISICLNYARSFYPNLTTKKLTDYELNNNLKIQLECLDLLNLIVKELVIIVKESGKSFACYIADMLIKCKIQKVLLHSLVSAVKCTESEKKSFTEEILIFNNFDFKRYDGKVSEYVESFQIQLLRLIQSLIALEYHVGVRGENSPVSPVPQQATFRAAILSALQMPSLRPLHRIWAAMVAASLPYFGPSLTQIVLSVIHQLCSNVETISSSYSIENNSDTSSKICQGFSSDVNYYSLKNLSTEFNLTPVDTIDDISSSFSKESKTKNLSSMKARSVSIESKRNVFVKDTTLDAIPDYAITQLESLTVLCHYCLLDNSQQYVNVLTQPSNMTSTVPSTLTNSTQIFNNLLHVFLPNPLIEDVSSKTMQESECYQEARRAVLSHMPRIVSSIALLWYYVSADEVQNLNSVLGCRKILRKQLLEFLSPISIHHSTHFLAAVGVAWNERKQEKQEFLSKTVLPQPTQSQKSLVQLISAIRVIPIDNLVQTIHSVIKTPPVTEGLKTDVNLEVSILELFYSYMQTVSNTQLLESWNSLLNLMKDTPTFNPPAQFLMLAILNEFVQKCSPMTEKKDQKDLQDVTSKIIESLSQISGSCLEQTTWLRRNLAVKEGDLSSSNNNLATPDIYSNQSYSVQAQLILAEILAPLLDVCFGSQEKDKVVSIVSSLMTNVVPYLRKHSARNAGSWTACSRLLASLSGYPATRRAWRREALELLLDPALFKMPQECLIQWRHIVDNLMTHDNTTFRELMSRVSVGQSGGLSLFSSREQEAEQRAMLLKRLAFVVLCGDTDQYSKHMPDIQEQLAGGLRLGASNVAAAVFLCCRALLLRVSPLHVTSLWPLILCECLQALLRVEHQLSSNSELISASVLGLDTGWSDNLTVDDLRLTLAALQLLDLALLMPPQTLPHFQMYRWAFVNESTEAHTDNTITSIFEPHLNRIARLMDSLYGPCKTPVTHTSSLLLSGCATEVITTLDDLHYHFKALSCRQIHMPASPADLLAAVELDFIEKMPL